MTQTDTPTFSTDPTGLAASQPTEVVRLADGDRFDLRLTAVAKQIGSNTVRMLAYNGSIPGPTIRVRQGSEITVRVRNDADHEATVHWHGLRLENRYDGVPHETQAPIPVGGSFTYTLQFPDDGLYWYHPHVREDYGLEMGLYGNIVVDPVDHDAWPAVDREAIITLDDLLIEDGHIATFRVDGPTHTAMGRFGNVMLTGGQADLALRARAGEVVRLFFTNTANTRIFNVGVQGARMKLVAGDSGRCEREQWIDTVLLAPSERAIVDVLYDTEGIFPITHTTPTSAYRLGSVHVADATTRSLGATQFDVLHHNDELRHERADLHVVRDRTPDKTLVFKSLMPILYGTPSDTSASAWTCPMHPEIVRAEPGTCPICGMKLIPVEPSAWTCPMHPEVVTAEPGTCPICGMKLIAADPSAADAGPPTMAHGSHDHDSSDGLEWEDLMPEINAKTDASNMIWKLVDADTGRENHNIDWSFTVGDRVKIRLVNTMDSEHPMHHPFHIHGAGRFLIVARDDVMEDNLMWKDTVLLRAGETVDILLDVTNPGLWMAHCHIAEHNQNGMMFSFRVAEA